MSLLLFFKPQFRILRAEIPQPYSRKRLAKARMEWRRRRHEERIAEMRRLKAQERERVRRLQQKREAEDMLAMEVAGLL